MIRHKTAEVGGLPPLLLSLAVLGDPRSLRSERLRKMRERYLGLKYKRQLCL
jgi:hypothetical protein